MEQQSPYIAAILSFDPIKEIHCLPEDIAWLEIRADKLPGYNPDKSKGLSYIYALRSKEHGGQYKGSSKERNHMLLEATVDYDLIELEADKDLSKEILLAIPPENRMIAWYGAPKSLEELREIRRQLMEIPARYYKIVPEARRSGEELAPLQLLKESETKNLIAYASGPIGLWTQIVAAYFDSPFVYGNLDEGSENYFSITQLIQDYALPSVHPIESLYGIVGNPVLKSLSPRLHNRTYLHSNFPGLFIPFHVESFDNFWTDIVQNKALHTLGLELKGLTTVSPYKEAALLKADLNQNSLTELVGSCNIVIHKDQQWIANTTDFYGVSTGLKELGISITDNKIAVIGCGGAGRTIAAGLLSAGASISLVNRGIERGENAAKLLGVEFQPLSNFDPMGFKVIINATPMGKMPVALPFDPQLLDNDAVVVDMAYGKTETLLIKKCMQLGIPSITGRLMLVLQVRRQFSLMTGRDMPLELAEYLADIKKQVEIVEQ
ncbi:MAG: type I 3-dehydroquinate dehydratase [Flavobacteriales bacterium]|nr:type I 3-dehydroquinate dehydratase [Flavobacteriales bacterium]